eukprot:CAMPEP_0175911070 /NCGR_PEP_ID=MMETSP0108-20121206/8001_1 /TAXON_ID=195067 ORGANISM="Goniomonas pacifica, Strain CCMP1869" /NCGR_SAMPLE_ID=MMETSP0108 /ASSEMBLY_ACC=CAM_ASM_000204 /LENGTH=57 /DNA_ID=CAMNT_0017233299 /DNA_START=361 /DNA_END=534 /DNA_ORIENTATION=-
MKDLGALHETSIARAGVFDCFTQLQGNTLLFELIENASTGISHLKDLEIAALHVGHV